MAREVVFEVAEDEETELDLLELHVPPKQWDVIPVGGRLVEYRKNWVRIGADQWILDLVTNGYRLEFAERLQLTRMPKRTVLPRDKVRVQALLAQVQMLLEKRVIETVLKPNTPGFYSRFFVVPKREPGKWRSIIDLSLMSRSIKKQKFKMETPELIRSCLNKGNWATSIDLTDAYYHVLIHPTDRKYLRFMVGNTVYQYRALPVGLASSPRTFTKVIRCIKEVAQKRGIKIYQYLDDWLIQATSRAQVIEHTQFILHLARALGFLVNFSKSELEPTQHLTYLGYCKSRNFR